MANNPTLTGVGSPLGYTGVNAPGPANFIAKNSAPTSGVKNVDIRNFNLGDIWLNTAANTPYMLVSKANNTPVWQSFGNVDLITIADDDGGTATPTSAGVITFHEGANIEIAAAGNAVTFSAVGVFDQITVTRFSISGTYTPTAGMKYCTVEVIGGGGGGGGCAATGAATGAAGGGGGAGGYSRQTFSASTIGASQVVTIGGGGNGGAAGNNTGITGGTTTFGALLQGVGGGGGAGSAAANASGGNGGQGGLASAGDINTTGANGSTGISLGTIPFFIGGAGANTIYGSGGMTGSGTAGQVNGNPAVNFGAGGSGGASAANGTSASGGNGSAGVVVVTEFIQ